MGFGRGGPSPVGVGRARPFSLGVGSKLGFQYLSGPFSWLWASWPDGCFAGLYLPHVTLLSVRLSLNGLSWDTHNPYPQQSSFSGDKSLPKLGLRGGNKTYIPSILKYKIFTYLKFILNFFLGVNNINFGMETITRET